MVKQKWQQILFFICLNVLLVMGLTVGANAELPVVAVKIPSEWGIHPQKVIFSEDGSKFALLLEEDSDQTLRGQVIVVYDFAKKEWKRAAALNTGQPWTLEPLAFNHDGSKLAIRLKDDLIIYDWNQNEMTHNIQDVGSETQVAFSPNGLMLAFLTNAEWETPTSLAILDLLTKDSTKALGMAVAYLGENSAAGPLSWGDLGEIFYVEEYTWGSMNARGILKQYLPDGDTVEIYNAKSPTTRVADYAFSPDRQHIALILRDLQEDLKTSRYGLLIRTPEVFVYGQQLPDWVDPLESNQSPYLSSSGWIGTKQFYWVNRTATGSTLAIYHLEQNKVIEVHSPEQVYISPLGVILKLER